MVDDSCNLEQQRKDARSGITERGAHQKVEVDLVKNIDLIRHLKRNGCELFREGGNHTIYVNRTVNKTSAVPRHREVKEFLVKKICEDLQIPKP